jgi:hypothetical protein
MSSEDKNEIAMEGVERDIDLDEVEVELEVAKLEIKSVNEADDLPVTSDEEHYIDDAFDEDSSEDKSSVARAVDDFTPQSTVDMANTPFLPYGKPVMRNKHLAMMMQGMVELEELSQEYDLNFNDTEQDKGLSNKVRRLKGIIGSLSDTLQTVYFRDIDKREGSDWGQGLLNGDQLVRAGKAKLRPDADPVLRIRNEMGLGSLVQIPLWHSGIWVTLKTPTDSALLELEQRMAMEKVTLGRASNGMVFSSAEVYTKSHLVDFIFDHIYSVTLDSKEPDVLRSVILDTDYPQLVWGMALAIYPAGYPLMQPCVANPDTCDHVVEALINLARISWVDRSKFSNSQKVHMLNRTKPNSLEKVEAYQKEFTTKIRGQIEVHPTVFLRLRVPTLAESQAIGYEWVEQILNTTQKAFGMRMADGAREQYVQQQALITSLRQYGHWFDAVIRTKDGEEEEVIDDRNSVDEIITMLTSDEEKTRMVYRTVRDYIDSASLSMIAIPKYKCPSCQGEPSEEYLQHPKLIPLDVVQVFFTLRDQKVTGKLVAEMTRNV